MHDNQRSGRHTNTQIPRVESTNHCLSYCCWEHWKSATHAVHLSIQDPIYWDFSASGSAWCPSHLIALHDLGSTLYYNLMLHVQCQSFSHPHNILYLNDAYLKRKFCLVCEKCFMDFLLSIQFGMLIQSHIKSMSANKFQHFFFTKLIKIFLKNYLLYNTSRKSKSKKCCFRTHDI